MVRLCVVGRCVVSCCRGPSRAMGYLGREEQSRDTFGARLIRTHTKQLGDEEEEEQAVYQHKGRSAPAHHLMLSLGFMGCRHCCCLLTCLRQAGRT